MELGDFTEILGDASARMAGLLDEALSVEGDPPTDMIRRVLQELATSMEELRVAEEELIVQSEQLASSHDAIDRERERYGQLFDFAPDGYVETDEHGKILEANTAAATLLGVSVRFLVGKLLVTFVDEADRRRFRRLLAEVAKGTVQGEVQVAFVPRDSVAFPSGVRVATDPMAGPGSTRLRWLIRDITERVRLEEERQALQEDLDVMVAMAELGRLTSGHDSVADVLDGMVEIARGIVNGSVSITLVDKRGRLTTASASDDVAARISDRQHVEGGPCAAAATAGARFEATVADLPADWGSLADLLVDGGFVQVLALPLVVEGEAVGAMNVYVPEVLNVPHRQALDLLAVQAAAAIGNAQLYASASELVTQLETALESRAIIEQAKGVLMALQHCGEDEAFDILRRASQRSNKKLRDVAAELVSGARVRHGHSSPPPPPRPS